MTGRRQAGDIMILIQARPVGIQPVQVEVLDYIHIIISIIIIIPVLLLVVVNFVIVVIEPLSVLQIIPLYLPQSPYPEEIVPVVLFPVGL